MNRGGRTFRRFRRKRKVEDAPNLSLLALEGITKSYGSTVANDAVSLTVHRGHIHALLGENGAGKSTLVKIIYGVTQPDTGVIRWRGEAITVRSPANARALGIGMVFQHFSLFETMTVVENISLAIPQSQRNSPGWLWISAVACISKWTPRPPCTHCRSESGSGSRLSDACCRTPN